MKVLNLPKMSTIKLRFKYYSNASSSLTNSVKRNFTVSKPNLVWCNDITYIKVNASFSYLCVIINLFSRKVIAHTLGKKQDSKLVIHTLDKALKERNIGKHIIFHSDRGTQYSSKETADFCDSNNITRSFSGLGNPYDNAVAESFFKFIKLEEVNREKFSDFTLVKTAICPLTVSWDRVE